MCGIVGVLVEDPNVNVNQLLFDAMTVLQHRGQDAAGMVTTSSRARAHLEMRKDNGLVKEVFEEQHMLKLVGNIGLGHVRYPTAGTKSLCAEAQPLYTNYPHGLAIAHNGTLTNTDHLRDILVENHRHINTGSDSEVLLNIFAMELETAMKKNSRSGMSPRAEQVTASREDLFAAATRTIATVTGGYAVILLVAGVGVLGFRDPNGIRPLCFGSSKMATGTTSAAPGGKETLVETSVGATVMSSESVAIDALGVKLSRDVAPGEAVLVDLDGTVHSQQCCPTAKLMPCLFEYVYFARPDSIMDSVPVYESRLRMGEKLALKIMRERPNHGIDVVIPIPDTSRASALQCAYTLGVPFREGFIKNRYIARTFIMPGQAARKKSVRLKLNTIKSEFEGKNVLLVDDSIVRGTTSREIVEMSRSAGAKKVFLVSAAPEIKWPNVYGIDIPTRTELIAHERSNDEIAKQIDVDWLIYQDLADLEESVRSLNPKIDGFEGSCFSGEYITPEVDMAYLENLEASRKSDKPPAYAAETSDTKSKAPTGDCEGLANQQNKRRREEGHLA
mmetsp:Transcript_58113/g.131680  ORF Transcript_58113/g.131680 Transcript_58113/m.131680 type:complete len:560 (+) Transcript_58113:71-1750(+)